MTVPQIRGMFNGMLLEKNVDRFFVFRLRAAYDNRPMRFEEFLFYSQTFDIHIGNLNEWEIGQSRLNRLNQSGSGIAEQLVRPYGNH